MTEASSEESAAGDSLVLLGEAGMGRAGVGDETRTVMAGAKKAWENVKACAELIPANARLIIKLMCELSAGMNETRTIAASILVDKLIAPAFDEPALYGLADDCVVSVEYLKVSSGVRKVLRGLITGRLLPPHDPLAASANGFISTSQYRAGPHQTDRKDVETFLGKLITADEKAPDEAEKLREVVDAKCSCLSLSDVQFVFDRVMQNREHYYAKYERLRNIISRFELSLTA